MIGSFGWWPVDSKGTQAFKAEMMNATLTACVRVDTRSGCDADGNAVITDLEIPLTYDEVTFTMNNLGDFYNTVVNGIGIFLISSQNTVAEAALGRMIARKIGSFTC